MFPRAFHSPFLGVAYQLGNMVSSASVQIEAAGGKHQWTTITCGRHNGGRSRLHEETAKVHGILIGCVAGVLDRGDNPRA